MGLFGGGNSTKKTDASTKVDTKTSLKIGNIGLTGNAATQIIKYLGAAQSKALAAATASEQVFVDAFTQSHMTPTVAPPAPSPSPFAGVMPYLIPLTTIAGLAFAGYWFFLRKH